MLFPLEADCPEFDDTSVSRAVLSDFYITSTQSYVLMIEYQVGFAWHLSKMVMIPCKLTNLCSFAGHVRVRCIRRSSVPLPRQLHSLGSTPGVAYRNHLLCYAARDEPTNVPCLLNRSLQIWGERSRGGNLSSMFHSFNANRKGRIGVGVS